MFTGCYVYITNSDLVHCAPGHYLLYKHKQNTVQGKAFVKNNKRAFTKYIPILSINSRVEFPQLGQLMFEGILNSEVSGRALEIDFFHRL